MKDNKKIRNVILIWGLVIVSLMIPCVAAAPPATGHPYMLFHDISEVPGYQYRTVAPWSTLNDRIIADADGSLTRDFGGNLGGYDSVMYRGNFARDLGLAYQITKQTKYAIKAKEALQNMTVGATDKMSKANALGGYSLAYDFIQPTLDPATDANIRDKLATLADTVYKDLNDNGTNPGYISFADYHGQAYPMVGVAGAALSDYTNPNNLPLSSTPADWYKAGTEYLFVNDALHSYGRSVFSFGFDEASGKHLNGAYKSYVIENFALWFQVSEHAYGENLLEIYPAAKKSVISETWESLPNQFTGNYVTNGNMGSVYHKTIVSLLPDSEKGPVLNHIDRLEAADKSLLLPYSGVYPASSNALIYCVYGNYAAIPRTFPTSLNHLDPNSIYQVFRGSWSDDADWLSLVTFNADSRSNRDMMHGDQLSIEYYSRGDLLLADAGENKYVLDGDYGYFDIHHNTIALEDPRTPFPVSPWSGSASAGIFKGYSMEGIATPVTVGTLVQEPWMNLLQTSATLTRVMAGAFGSDKTLSSPIQYERTILYPDSDYFVIVDRMEGTEAWKYRNIFRPTSLVVTPTVDANKDGSYSQSEVGHVNGALTIGSTPYDWQSLAYKAETNTGITANSLIWTTKNPYGKDVRLNLVSSPASEILIEKNVGRIGGYGAKSEVYSPIVYFRTTAANSEYRVTALLSSYTTETAKTATEITVTGTGHAIKVSSPSSDDYIYTGKGTSSFAGFTTDADTVYIRQRGVNVQVTLLDGSYLKYQNDPWVALSKKSDSITAYREKGSTDYRIQGESDLRGDIFQQPFDSNKIKKRPNTNEQQKSNEQQKPMVKSDINVGSEESSDMIAFLVKLAESVLSVFTPNTKPG
jgi:hypothetical protein